MAHWIIDDHGFAGIDYTCSECGNIFNNLYTDISSGDNCPYCHTHMDENETNLINELLHFAKSNNLLFECTLDTKVECYVFRFRNQKQTWGRSILVSQEEVRNIAGSTTDITYKIIEALIQDLPNQNTGYDRRTALAVLNDITIHMRPSIHIFGNETLEIDRYRFDAIKRKFLGNKETE